MKKIFFAAVVTTLLVVFSQSACYYDNELEQYGVSECDTTAVSYANDIAPLIQQQCISCHTPGGEQESTPFDTYNDVVLYTVSIAERVNGIGSIMPPTGKLSTCNVSIIEAWINAGAPNN
ncbi:MAG: hypothetical protein JNJ57_22040 [Saprospiraceae bacterium]|nr:hypothetical protein [Saprospiraceae bacterium]